MKNTKARRRRRNQIFTVYLITILLLLSGILLFRLTGDETYTSARDNKSADYGINLEVLNSKNAILMEVGKGEVLGELSSQNQIYPASMTKIMTAILSIENLEDLEETTKLSTDIFQSLYEQNASQAGFEPGEDVEAIDLIYGVMLPSGAECCIALTERIAGSEEAFVDMMNQKAQELGMTDTHFTNSTGLHHDEHYTTVRDMAVLLRYALRNETFWKVFTSPRHSTASTNVHAQGITFQSTMFKNMENAQVTGGEIIGGKTGYTSDAGLCLASMAKVGEDYYILVTAGAEGSHETEQFHITDATQVYNQLGEELVH